jgi:hypothetical protein
MGNWSISIHCRIPYWCGFFQFCDVVNFCAIFFHQMKRMEKKSDFKEFLGSFFRIKIIKLLTSRHWHYLGHPCDHTVEKKAITHLG